MTHERWQDMKTKTVLTIAVFVFFALILMMVPGCSAVGKKPSDPSENGTGIPGGDPSVRDGSGGENGSRGRTDAETGDQVENDGNIQPGEGSGTTETGSFEERLATMSLDEKIGQMFIIGVEGTSVDKDMLDILAALKPGGIILFRKNITDPYQLVTFTNSLKIANPAQAPLFISIDEEGGRVSRMPGHISGIPPALSVGELDDESFTYETGRLIAEMVKSFGINMDFAPVLDIFSNPDNTVIGDRAYGTTPLSVVEHGIQVMKGIRDEGIISVVKHFPGHGDTDVDSHYGLPAVVHDKGRLSNFELVPFRKAIEENADAIMVAHIVVESVDPGLPASLSDAVINGLLRGEMGFEGVVVTDDMTMGAITEYFDIGDAAVKSVLAGNDIILVCHGYENQKKAMDAIKDAVGSGIINEGRIDESVARILTLKKKYSLNDRSVRYPDVERLNKKIEGVLSKWYNDN